MHCQRFFFFLQRNSSSKSWFIYGILWHVNIPLDETIQICVDLVYNKRRKVKGMLKRHFKELLTISVKSSCFIFNDVYYKQIDGVAMGSLLGPTLANLFLAYHEDKWLQNCPLQFRPRFYRRYVDDIFLMFENNDYVKKFLRYMNSPHPKIKLTRLEVKNNHNLIRIPWKNIITVIFRTCQNNVKLNIVFRSSNRIRNAFRFFRFLL